MIVGKTVRMVARLAREAPPDGRVALARLVGDEEFLGTSKVQPLDAARCALLSRSAQLDPLRFVDTEVKELLHDPSRLLPTFRPGMCPVSRVDARDKEQYAFLVLRQLRAGKVTLRCSISAGASVFTVGKRGGTTLREVWNGKRLSELAVRPPKPPHLLSPTCLLHLEASSCKPIRVWKRDSACMFDQLALSSELIPFVGRPPLLLHDLFKCHRWAD